MRIKDRVQLPDWQQIGQGVWRQIQGQIESQLRDLQVGQSLAVHIGTSSGDGLADFTYKLRMLRIEGGDPYDFGPGEWTIYTRGPDPVEVWRNNPDLEGCQAGSDGECNWKHCPQLVDYKSICPRHVHHEED